MQDGPGLSFADTWIVTKHKYFRHETVEAAEAERNRLIALVPGSQFRVYRVKATLSRSEYAEKMDRMAALLAAFAAARDEMADRLDQYDALADEARLLLAREAEPA